MSRKLKNFWRDDGFLKKEREWFKKREYETLLHTIHVRSIMSITTDTKAKTRQAYRTMKIYNFTYPACFDLFSAWTSC